MAGGDSDDETRPRVFGWSDRTDRAVLAALTIGVLAAGTSNLLPRPQTSATYRFTVDPAATIDEDAIERGLRQAAADAHDRSPDDDTIDVTHSTVCDAGLCRVESDVVVHGVGAATGDERARAITDGLPDSSPVRLAEVAAHTRNVWACRTCE